MKKYKKTAGGIFWLTLYTLCYHLRHRLSFPFTRRVQFIVRGLVILAVLTNLLN